MTQAYHTMECSHDAVPTNRIKKLWKMVEGGAPWNQHYFQVVRDRMDRMGIISIFDRNHHNGKAWRWEAGESFPEEDYREEQRKLRQKQRLPGGEAEDLRDLVGITTFVKNNQVHNSTVSTISVG